MRELVILSILVFSVFSSKQILIYNEEIIVALSFVAFVLFSQRALGDTVRATFADRRASVLAELLQFLSAKDALLAELLSQHALRSQSVRSSTQMLGDSCIKHMVTSCAPKCKHTVLALLSQQYAHKLSTLLAVQDQSRVSFQDQMVTSFRDTVCDDFSVARTNQSKLVVKQSIAVFKENYVR
jgi:hypothetical protein